MAVITISRLFGAGGWTLATRLSETLGYKCINEDMIKDAASKLNVSSGQVQNFEKDGASKLMWFIDKMINTNFIDRHISERYSYVNEQSYVEVIRKIIIELHEKGNMIIIGRGGQYILKDFPGTRHILLVQELSSRIRFMMKNYNLSLSEAEKAIKQRDQIRTRFLGFFTDKRHIDDPNNYDLVINMDRISMEKAEKLIMGLISD
jgi:cytidylate kinase